MTLEPHNNQEVTNKDIEQQISGLARTVQMLSDVLSTHVRNNIETLREIREYIGSQITYRSFREGIEENQLKLEIEQKNLEIRYKEKLLLDETSESDALKLERDKLKLEMESLKKNLEVLQVVKHSTQEKIKGMPPSQPANLTNEAKKTFILTAVAFFTTSFLGGVITIIYFVIRQYILSNP